jgi:hypothetical protein
MTRADCVDEHAPLAGVGVALYFAMVFEREFKRDNPQVRETSHRTEALSQAGSERKG